MDILDPRYVYSPTLAKRKRCIIGEVMLWIVGVTLLVLGVGAIIALASLIFWAVAMATWGWPKAFWLTLAILTAAEDKPVRDVERETLPTSEVALANWIYGLTWPQAQERAALLHPPTENRPMSEGEREALRQIVKTELEWCEFCGKSITSEYTVNKLVNVLAARPASNEVRHKIEIGGPPCPTCGFLIKDGGRAKAPVFNDDETLAAEPIESRPDWPPRASASVFPDGHQSYGSTGQLFEVKNGQWVRVREPNKTKGK